MTQTLPENLPKLLSITYFDDLEKKRKFWYDLCQPISPLQNQQKIHLNTIQKARADVAEILKNEDRAMSEAQTKNKFVNLDNVRTYRAVFFNVFIWGFNSSLGFLFGPHEYYSTNKGDLRKDMVNLIVAEINFLRNSKQKSSLSLVEIKNYINNNNEKEIFGNNVYNSDPEKLLLDELKKYSKVDTDTYQKQFDAEVITEKRYEIMETYIIERMDKDNASNKELSNEHFQNMTLEQGLKWTNLFKKLFELKDPWNKFKEEILATKISSTQEFRMYFSNSLNQFDAVKLVDLIVSSKKCNDTTLDAISARIRNMEGISDNRKSLLLKGVDKLKEFGFNYDLSEKNGKGNLKEDLKHIFVAILTGKHTNQASQSLKNIKESSLSKEVGQKITDDFKRGEILRPSLRK